LINKLKSEKEDGILNIPSSEGKIPGVYIGIQE